MPRLLHAAGDSDAAPLYFADVTVTTAEVLGLNTTPKTLVAAPGVGNLLVAAILVGPAATARLLTHRIAPMITVSITVALIAGGVGSAPLLLLARQLLERGTRFDFFYGGRGTGDLARASDFERLAVAAGARGSSGGRQQR